MFDKIEPIFVKRSVSKDQAIKKTKQQKPIHENQRKFLEKWRLLGDFGAYLQWRKSQIMKKVFQRKVKPTRSQILAITQEKDDGCKSLKVMIQNELTSDYFFKKFNLKCCWCLTNCCCWCYYCCCFYALKVAVDICFCCHQIN